MDLLCFCSVLCVLCLCARLWSPAGKGLTSWLSFVVSNMSLSQNIYPILENSVEPDQLASNEAHTVFHTHDESIMNLYDLNSRKLVAAIIIAFTTKKKSVFTFIGQI